MNPEFKELLLAFNAHGVEYLGVGAHALAAYGHVRATKELDVWVRPNQDNGQRVIAALAEFGAPVGDLLPDDLAKPGTIFQIGVPPLRVDIITDIDVVSFSDAWPKRSEFQLGAVPVLVISRQHLIINKKSAGRLQDLADAEKLEHLAQA